jgi:hypothetical protein
MELYSILIVLIVQAYGMESPFECIQNFTRMVGDSLGVGWSIKTKWYWDLKQTLNVSGADREKFPGDG